MKSLCYLFVGIYLILTIGCSVKVAALDMTVDLNVMDIAGEQVAKVVDAFNCVEGNDSI